MATRITIELPEPLPFTTRISVRIGDINYGGHVGNDAMLRIMQDARLRFLAQYGWSELDTAGASLIMTDACVIYKAQARFGDDLEIGVASRDLTRTGFTLVYRIVRTQDRVEIARGETGMAFFDYGRNRVARMPEAFRQACG
ncbi:MAG TPA: thioesterase family protein [Kiritimatiellia bacterium]|nr:thioesterase family protein [Kiritimatiellia bacterium]